MEIFTFVWQNYLYVPLLNSLIWLYINYSHFNLGIAVIIMTVILRIILLPLTVIGEMGKTASQKLTQDIRQVEKDFTGDPVKKKLVIRQMMKKRKIRPWAKAVVLGVQALVLVILYQVFIGGINTETKFHLLYPSLPRPDFINTKFLWFDIAQRNLLAAIIVGVYLFVEILIQRHLIHRQVSKKEQIYSLLFPIFAVLLLVTLPSVKSIFILTSLIISSIISIITALIKLIINQAKKKPHS